MLAIITSNTSSHEPQPHETLMKNCSRGHHGYAHTQRQFINPSHDGGLWPFNAHQAGGDPQYKILTVKSPDPFSMGIYIASDEVLYAKILATPHLEVCK